MSKLKYRNKLSILLFVIIVSCSVFGQDKPDAFIAIAESQRKIDREVLVKPGPPNLPAIDLPISDGNAKRNFQPQKHIRTNAQLHKLLAEYREHYKPFLKNHAPDLEKKRIRQHFEQFKWRIETPKDQQDFAGYTLKGKGKWAEVMIPHYGPPVGKVATYYYKQFNINTDLLDCESVFICFKGVDYKAHVFVNGIFLGSHEGFFAPFEFDCTTALRKGKNTLVVKVENDYGTHPTISTHEGDKMFSYNSFYAVREGPTFQRQKPPLGWLLDDVGMGIHHDVYLEGRGRIFVDDVFVRTLDTEGNAELWLDVYQVPHHEEQIRFAISVYGRNFEQTVIEDMNVIPTSALDKPLHCKAGLNYFKIPLSIPQPRYWAPENPWLYQLAVKLYDKDNILLDTFEDQFGLRTFTMREVNGRQGHFFLNGQPIRLYGANTHGAFEQDVIRRDWDRLVDDILLAKICNMNYIRTTGRPLLAEVYDYFDRLGLMAQTDMPICSDLRRNLFNEALKQAGEMEQLVRNHPSNIMISYINERIPNMRLKEHHRMLTRPEMENFFQCADSIVNQYNPDRVIKAAEGDYDPPAPGISDQHCYCAWYNGHTVDLGKLNKGYFGQVKKGWNYTCGEFGIEGLDSLELMKKYYPESWLQSADDGTWSPNVIIDAQTGKMHYIWYDTPQTIDEWIAASRAYQAWGIRYMTEAFRRNSRMSGFAIHLFIDAFPSGWMKAIVDYDRKAKPVYFAYRDALAPVLVSLRTDRNAFFADEPVNLETWVCSDLNRDIQNAHLCYYVEHKSEILYSGQSPIDINRFENRFTGSLKFNAPSVNERGTFRVFCGLTDDQGNIISDNSITLDVFATVKPKPSRRIVLVANDTSEAGKLLNALNLSYETDGPFEQNDVIVVDSGSFKDRQDDILNAVRNGAAAVVFKLPVGEHDLGFGKITVYPAPMNPLHFVSRKTGHPLVEGFQPDDFKLWHDDETGYITPFFALPFDGKEWLPILKSAKRADHVFVFEPALAAAEKELGQGRIIISQIDLTNRVKTNPVAKIYALRLLDAD